MRALLATVVDGGDLLRVVWVSIASGLGVTTVFAIAIVGTSRALDLRRDGRPIEAAAYGAIGVLALAGVAAAVVFAIIVMAHKS